MSEAKITPCITEALKLSCGIGISIIFYTAVHNNSPVPYLDYLSSILAEPLLRKRLLVLLLAFFLSGEVLARFGDSSRVYFESDIGFNLPNPYVSKDPFFRQLSSFRRLPLFDPHPLGTIYHSANAKGIEQKLMAIATSALVNAYNNPVIQSAIRDNAHRFLLIPKAEIRLSSPYLDVNKDAGRGWHLDQGLEPNLDKRESGGLMTVISFKPGSRRTEFAQNQAVDDFEPFREGSAQNSAFSYQELVSVVPTANTVAFFHQRALLGGFVPAIHRIPDYSGQSRSVLHTNVHYRYAGLLPRLFMLRLVDAVETDTAVIAEAIYTLLPTQDSYPPDGLYDFIRNSMCRTPAMQARYRDELNTIVSWRPKSFAAAIQTSPTLSQCVSIIGSAL